MHEGNTTGLNVWNICYQSGLKLLSYVCYLRTYEI